MMAFDATPRFTSPSVMAPTPAWMILSFTRSLESFATTRHHVLLNELDDVRSRITVLTRARGAWRRSPVPGLPPLASAWATAVDEETSDDYWLTVTDFLTPTSLYLGNVGNPAREKLKQTPAFFDGSRHTVSQHEAISKDGTRIPYFEVAPSKLTLDGHAPTLLTRHSR